MREDGSPCDPNEEGELVHRGPLVAMGTGTTRVARPSAWPAPHREDGLSTTELAVLGDIVTRDEEGFLYFVGRKDDMIKTSGRVAPTEIEEIAYDTGWSATRWRSRRRRPHRPGHRAVVSPEPGTGFEAAALLDELRGQLPLYMVLREIVSGPSCPAPPTASSTALCSAGS